MDVNEALRIVRESFAQGDDETARFAFQDLDEWLSKGGFLPADWNKGRATRRYGNPRPAFGEE